MPDPTPLGERLDALTRRGYTASESGDWFQLQRDIRRMKRRTTPGSREHETAKALEHRLVEIVSPPTRGHKPPNDSQEN